MIRPSQHREYWDFRSKEFKNRVIDDDMRLLLDVVRKHAKNGKILEIGCGWGRLMNEIESYGIDFSKAMLEKNKFYPDKALLANAKNLPFNDKEFEVGYTHSCFMHIPHEEIDKAIKEIQRVAETVILCEWQDKEDDTRYYTGEEGAGCFSHDYEKNFGMRLVNEIVLKDKRKILVFNEAKKEC